MCYYFDFLKCVIILTLLGKVKSIDYHPYHPTQECHQPINIAEPAAAQDSSRPVVIVQAQEVKVERLRRLH